MRRIPIDSESILYKLLQKFLPECNVLCFPYSFCSSHECPLFIFELFRRDTSAFKIR